MILPAATLSGADAALAAATVPPCLVSPAAAGRIANLSALLPEGAVCLILEMRLDGGGEAVDVSQAFVPGAMPALAKAARDSPALVGLLPFMDWAAEARPRAIWLEWDLVADRPAGGDCPGAFFALPDPPPEGIDRFVGAGLRALDRAEMAEPVHEALAAVAGQARLRQVGFLPTRPDGGVRLVLETAGADAVRAVIDRLVPDARGDLERLLALPGFVRAERTGLDVLGPGRIGPRISLEQPGAGLTGAEMQDCCAALVRAGLADERAAAATAEIVDWAGVGGRMVRGLSHLKASARAGMPLEVKVYQGFVPRPDAILVQTSR